MALGLGRRGGAEADLGLVVEEGALSSGKVSFSAPELPPSPSFAVAGEGTEGASSALLERLERSVDPGPSRGVVEAGGQRWAVGLDWTPPMDSGLALGRARSLTAAQGGAGPSSASPELGSGEGEDDAEDGGAGHDDLVVVRGIVPPPSAGGEGSEDPAGQAAAAAASEREQYAIGHSSQGHAEGDPSLAARIALAVGHAPFVGVFPVGEGGTLWLVAVSDGAVMGGSDVCSQDPVVLLEELAFFRSSLAKTSGNVSGRHVRVVAPAGLGVPGAEEPDLASFLAGWTGPLLRELHPRPFRVRLPKLSSIPKRPLAIAAGVLAAAGLGGWLVHAEAGRRAASEAAAMAASAAEQARVARLEAEHAHLLGLDLPPWRSAAGGGVSAPGGAAAAVAACVALVRSVPLDAAGPFRVIDSVSCSPSGAELRTVPFGGGGGPSEALPLAPAAFVQEPFEPRPVPPDALPEGLPGEGAEGEAMEALRDALGPDGPGPLALASSGLPGAEWSEASGEVELSGSPAQAQWAWLGFELRSRAAPSDLASWEEVVRGMPHMEVLEVAWVSEGEAGGPGGEWLLRARFAFESPGFPDAIVRRSEVEAEIAVLRGGIPGEGADG